MASFLNIVFAHFVSQKQKLFIETHLTAVFLWKLMLHSHTWEISALIVVEPSSNRFSFYRTSWVSAVL